MFETLLLNILFLILPLLLFVIFFENHINLFNKWFFLMFSSVSMFLCMFYPFRLELGFIFDLRYIPFIIVALYGGYRQVFPLYVILNIYRLLIGGEGTMQSFLFSTAIFIAIPLFSKKFNKSSTPNRVIIGVIAAVMTMGLYLWTLSSFFDELTRGYWLLVFSALTTHIVVIALNLMMTERVLFNIKSRKNILHAERLHVMNELSASVSHEIRNPLTVTKGFIQIVKESNSLTSEEKVYLDYSLNELKRAENILNDFLAFAKPQSENMVYANMEEEVEYVRNILMPYARMNQVDIHCRFTNTLKKRYDKNQLQQCLINMCKNGIESMKEKGGILNIEVFEQDRNIMISIQDNGIGMTSDEILQLGKPYYSTKKEGTGLGMLMVYGAISKVRGEIHVESIKGSGTTFMITIPT